MSQKAKRDNSMEMEEIRDFSKQEADQLLGSAVKLKKTLDDISFVPAGTKGKVTDIEKSENTGGFYLRIRWHKENHKRPIRRYYSKDAFEEWVDV